MAEPFRVLVVCAANVCRSPLAELLLHWTLADAGLGELVEVGSAGTEAEVGEPMCGGAARWVHHAGYRSSAVTAELLRGAGLVLAADHATAAACAILQPRCRHRLFTLSQAAVLADAVSARLDEGPPLEGAPPLPAEPRERLGWLVDEWDAARAVLAGISEGTHEIVDRHGLAPHDEVFAEIEEAVARISDGLIGVLAVPSAS